MNSKKKSSSLPYVIIGLVLVVVLGMIALGTGLIGTGIWMATSGTNSSTATATPSEQPRRAPANASAGAPLGVNMLGSPDAIVTVEEFADFQCGACAATHPVIKEMLSTYAGNPSFRFVFRNYPLSIPQHDKAYYAAVAIEAAGMQGKFWQMQDLLFRNQSSWTNNANYLQMWEDYAISIGMDIAKFKADMAGSVTKQRVDADLARGRGLGVTSTPTVYVNGVMVPYADLNITGLRRAVEAEMQRASQPAAANTTGSNPSSK